MPAGFDDRHSLQQAVLNDRGWQAIYFAKRILQANSMDEEAENAVLRLVQAHMLVYRQQTVTPTGPQDRLVPNPFLGELDSRARLQIIRTAQLMERRCGEVLCRKGDEGDTMFIVLEGKVGAFRHDERTGGLELNPFVEFRPGEIVGELAFTLHRPRTATLLAVEDVSLLAVHAGELKKQAERIPHLAASLERFLTGRIVEYVCNSVPYLIGREQTGPLVDVARRKNWDSIVEHAEKIACPLADARPITMEDARFAGNGLYVLVSGSLRSKEFPDKVFSGDNLPLIYVDLPGRMVCPNHVYIPEGNDVVFLRIGQDAFLGRKPVINDLVVHVRHQLPQLYRYDVFLSHTFDDRDEAVRWHDALTAAGLRVYMEHPTTGKYFRDHIQAAILDSLALLALVSANTMVRPIEQNWVRREIAFRKNVFEADYARILPTRLRGGQPEKLAEGYTVIESIGREEAAIAEVIAAVCRIKQSEPPFARARKIGILISES